MMMNSKAIVEMLWHTTHGTSLRKNHYNRESNIQREERGKKYQPNCNNNKKKEHKRELCTLTYL